MNPLKKLFGTKMTIILLCLFIQNIVSAQVTDVKYMLRFNEITGLFDAFLVAEAGNATTVQQRTQFNSQFSVVVPSGSSVSVSENFLPLVGNQNYNSMTPREWHMVNSILAPLSNPHNDYHAIIPGLSPSAHYNNITEGDTLKLFSLSVQPIPACKQEVRMFENDTDPTSQDPSFMGGDFTNGFTMGGALQLYNGNIVGNLIPIPTVAITGDDSICISNITQLSPSTGGVWTSIYPNVASVSFFGAVTALSEGNARFIFRDNMTGCRSLPTNIVTVNPRPQVTFTGDQNVCVGETTSLSPDSSGVWISNNTLVASITNEGIVTALNVGAVTFTYTSSITGCSRTSGPLTVNRAQTFILSYFVCSGSTFTLSPNPYPLPITQSPNNPSGCTIEINNGIYTFQFSDEASGKYDFLPNNTDCIDTLRIIVTPRPTVSFTGDQHICVGETTRLAPTSGGTWFSSNPFVASISNSGLVTAASPGTAIFIYTSTSSGCTSLPTAPITVSLPPIVTVSRDTIDVGKTASLTQTTGGTWFSNDTNIVKIINNTLASGISSGSTSIYFVSDTTNCSSRNVNMVVTDPMSSIVGFAFRDINGNGLFDSQTDSPLPNCAINIASINSTFYTDKTGYYDLSLVPGVYELNFTLPYGNWTNNSITKTVTANNAIEYVFVGFTPEAEETNALVTINPSNLVCNNLENLSVTVFNNTSQLVSGYLGIHIDEKTFVSSSEPFPVGSMDDVIFWEFIDLLPGHTFTPNIVLDIPLPQMEGDSLFFEAFSISQNSDTLSTFVYADAINCGQSGQNMLNWPNRPGEENFTLRDESLDYLIRFENKTSSEVNTVTIVNTLDKNIDLSSILIKEASHNMTTYKEDDKIYFVFENINLGGRLGSDEGYVAFQCKFKEDLADGTIITNIAELSFDDKKETTNTTVNTIISSVPCVTQQLDVEVCPSEGYTIGQTTYFEAGSYGEILPGTGTCDTFQMVHVSLLSEPLNGLTQQGILLVAEGTGNNYYWYECNNPNQIVATTATYAPSQNGSYFVIVDGEFCSSKSACVDFILSNNEDLLKENIKIFPNPTLDMLNIESNIAIEQISIKNILGALQSINKTNTSIIDLGPFVNGIYFIEIKTAQGTLISKVIKQ